MKEIVDKIKDLVDAESFSDGWTFRKHNPVWRNPSTGKVLAIYGTRRGRGEFRVTGSEENVYEIIIEYTEGASTQTQNLERDEAAELAVCDVLDRLVTWVFAHQTLSLQSLPEVHRFDWVETRYPDGVRREASVRYGQVIVQARRNQAYG